MKPKLIPLLEMCIDNGIERGWARAHKHDDGPSPEAVKVCIMNAIFAEIDEWFELGQGDGHELG